MVNADSVLGGPMSDEMAWGELYELALQVAREHGATIPDRAKDVGRYDFTNRVTRSSNEIALAWKWRKTR